MDSAQDLFRKISPSDAGLIGSRRSKVKILGNGELTKRLEITANKFSKTAEQKIEACGGTAKVV